MNNKGFAISGILYSILLLFLMLLLSLLHVLITRINRLTSLVEKVNSDVEDIGCASSDPSSCTGDLVYDPEYGDSDTFFTTKIRGKYTLKINDSDECFMYLPKNISLIVEDGKIKYIKPNDEGVIDVTSGDKIEVVGHRCGSSINKFNVTKINSSFYD